MGDNWYYESDGQVLGPVSKEKLMKLAVHGSINSDSRIRRGDNSAWMRAGPLFEKGAKSAEVAAEYRAMLKEADENEANQKFEVILATQRQIQEQTHGPPGDNTMRELRSDMPEFFGLNVFAALLLGAGVLGCVISLTAKNTEVIIAGVAARTHCLVAAGRNAEGNSEIRKGK